MVVSCQKCRTRFQLDEARIPEKGVRVRCSKCKHAFFVARPGSRDASIHGLAEQAAVHGRPAKAKPGASVDLPPVASSEPEDDWQFNIDPPGGGGAKAASPARDFDDRTPPPAEITDSEPTESESVDSFFELDGLSDPGPESEPGRAAAPLAADEGRKSKPSAKKAAPPPIEPEQEVTFEDLGSPESWDFGVDAPRAAAPQPAPAKVAAKAKKGAAKKQAAAARIEEAPAPLRHSPEARSRADSLSGSFAGAAGWLLALALFAFGLHGALTPLPAALAPFPPVRVGPLELADVRVRHVENLFGGPLVVVAGELRNTSAATVQAGGAPRVQVTDALGQALEAPAGWLGVARSVQDLREADPDALAEEQARSAGLLAQRSFAPQESVSVTAVLAELPPDAAAFRIEVAALEELPAQARPASPDALRSAEEEPAEGAAPAATPPSSQPAAP